MIKIKTVTVIGANGTMGCNVAAIFSSFGAAKVYMVGRSLEKVQNAVQRAVNSVRADSIAAHLIPVNYDSLDDCIAESDFIFESVAESFETKRDIIERIKDHVRSNAIVATGSSGLSITMLAEVFPEQLRSRFFGVHMFNPPYNLTLCEVIDTKYSNQKLLKELKEYLSGTLYRSVVQVKDSSAFLGNRIGFQFINHALLYAEKYKHSGGIDYIDAILGNFTGRSMAPLVTSDFVGLDVHKAIVDNIFENVPDYSRDSFVLPEYTSELIEKGCLGRKTKEKGGLYKQEVYDNQFKRITVYDIASGVYRDKYNYCFPFAEKMKKALSVGDYKEAFATLVTNHSVEAEICLEFLLEYIIYSLYCAKEVGYSIHAADDVMATGFNWCPPLAMAQAIGTVTDIRALMHERLDEQLLKKIDLNSLLDELEASQYDYRPYFKSI